MRILVTGSRTWTDRRTIRDALVQAWRDCGDATLVHGDATGADRIAASIWEWGRLPVEPHPADWRPSGIYNPHAGKARNQKMVDLGADLCLAFIRDSSAGATDCAARAEEAGIPVRYFRDHKAEEEPEI